MSSKKQQLLDGLKGGGLLQSGGAIVTLDATTVIQGITYNTDRTQYDPSFPSALTNIQAISDGILNVNNNVITANNAITNLTRSFGFKNGQNAQANTLQFWNVLRSYTTATANTTSATAINRSYKTPAQLVTAGYTNGLPLYIADQIDGGIAASENYGTAAAASALAAANSATDASGSKVAAIAARDTAVQSASDASGAKVAAIAARDTAVQSASDASGAKVAAIAARDTAVQSASDASGAKVAAIAARDIAVQSASDASGAKVAAETARDAAIAAAAPYAAFETSFDNAVISNNIAYSSGGTHRDIDTMYTQLTSAIAAAQSAAASATISQTTFNTMLVEALKTASGTPTYPEVYTGLDTNRAFLAQFKHLPAKANLANVVGGGARNPSPKRNGTDELKIKIKGGKSKTMKK